MPERPVRLVVEDDLARNRLTVFFRLLLVIPHLVWLTIWGIGVLVAALVNWVATLVRGASPAGLHRFLARYLAYATHVAAYLHLVANPYPGFTGAPGYPVEAQIDPPRRQSRWSVFFRGILVLPALLIESALGGFAVHGRYSAGLIVIAAFLGWFASLARGRMPRGLRDAGVYALSYSIQLSAYLLLLTDRYPSSDPPATVPGLPTTSHPVRLDVDDDLRRSRLTVFFRLLLALPHLIWLYLWAIVALFAAFATWIATLVSGRPPAPLHRFLSAFVRYATHVNAYLALVANPFPGFTGKPGSYPVEAITGEVERQNRWTVFFRVLLAFPALLVAGAYGNLLWAAALLGWFASLVTGRMPQSLRNAQSLALRYTLQTYGYVLLLTGSYPYSGPTAGAPVPPLDAPAEPVGGAGMT